MLVICRTTFCRTYNYLCFRSISLAENFSAVLLKLHQIGQRALVKISFRLLPQVFSLVWSLLKYYNVKLCTVVGCASMCISIAET